MKLAIFIVGGRDVDFTAPPLLGARTNRSRQLGGPIFHRDAARGLNLPAAEPDDHPSVCRTFNRALQSAFLHFLCSRWFLGKLYHTY